MTSNNDAPAIHIDKGTVYLKIAQGQLSQPHNISWRPQGSCVPEVRIRKEGKHSQVTHIADCHGKGDHQGTVFEIELAKDHDHQINLNAGQIFVPSVADLQAISRISSKVKVGGIHGGGSATKIQRKMLLGAESETINPNVKDGVALFLNVNMGGIDFGSSK